MGVAGTNANLAKYQEERSPLCPSCEQCEETTAHVLHCSECGRVAALQRTIDNLEQWLESVGTERMLAKSLVSFARGRGGRTMEEVVRPLPLRYQRLGRSQDAIGWRRFMEGMISKEVVELQREYITLSGSRLSLQRWAIGLVTKLLEVTHGQWLYRNVTVHDATSGTLATLRKEELQMEIEKQQELGGEGLLDEDRYLLEVNLDDLETTSGEWQEYWLLAIRAAREACNLRRQQTNNNAQEGTAS